MCPAESAGVDLQIVDAKITHAYELEMMPGMLSLLRQSGDPAERPVRTHAAAPTPSPAAASLTQGPARMC